MSTDLQARLAEAEQAYHDLLRGNSVTYVRDSTGEAISFQKADIDKLSQYIQQLKRQVGGTRFSPLKIWMG